MSMAVLWVLAAAAFLALELVTVAMVSLWFMAGALAAALAAALHAALWVQILVFLAVSGLCFLVLYPRLGRMVKRGSQATNADMVLGQTCLVTRRIDNLAGTGAVSVGGKTWSARSTGGQSIGEGTLVRAERIEGVKLYVTPVDQA